MELESPATPQVPPETPFTGFWLKDAARTTAPKPIDDAMHVSAVCRRTHESVTSLKVSVECN